MVFLTDFGDSAVLLPLAAAMLLWLLAARAPAAALWWLVALAIVIGGIGAAKIRFFACLGQGGIQSPSGHTGLATLIYGGVAVAITDTVAGWRRWAVILAASLFILGIAISRLALGAHSLSEVCVGLAAGALALAVFVRGYRRRRPMERSLAPLLAAGMAVLVLFYGRQLHAEEMLHAVAGYLPMPTAACG